MGTAILAETILIALIFTGLAALLIRQRRR